MFKAHKKISMLAKQVRPGEATVPAYAGPGESGMDVRAYVLDPELKQLPWYKRIAWPKTIKKVPTAYGFDWPVGYDITLRPRSGASSKGFFVIEGTIDSTFQGAPTIVIYNMSWLPKMIRHDERLAQLVMTPVVQADLYLVNDLPDYSNNRADKGFGSTGRN